MSPESHEIKEFLLDRGAGRLPHPGGTLYEHLVRVTALLAEWEPTRTCRAAGLCHACCRAAGYGHALLGLDERAVLGAVVGARAGPVSFRDRFTRPHPYTAGAGDPRVHRPDRRQRTRPATAQPGRGCLVWPGTAAAFRSHAAVAHRCRLAGLEPAPGTDPAGLTER